MKPDHTITALALATLAAPALAQDPASQLSCADFRAVSDKAPERFVSLRGEKLAPDYYKSTAKLPPFRDCTLTDKGLAAIICNRTTTRKDAIDGAFIFLAAQVKACYPSWQPDMKDPGPSPNFPGSRMIKFQGLSEETPTGKRTIFVGLVSHTAGGKTTYALSLSFIALPQRPSVS